MREIVAIWYRGSSYQIGRGRDFYGIWPAAESVSEPLERWPLTREGWYGAWSRFTAVEAPGTIVQAGPSTVTPANPQSSVTPANPQPAVPPGSQATVPPGSESTVPPGSESTVPPGSESTMPPGSESTMPPGSQAAVPPGPKSAVPPGLPTSAPPGPRAATPPGPRIFMPAAPTAAAPTAADPTAAGPGFGVPTVQATSVPGGQSATPVADAGRPAVIAAVLLGIGVVCGVIGLFPDYFSGANLVQHADQLLPHVIYLAGWTASAVLILLGGSRARMGALFGLGLSVVAFGFFFADLGAVIAGGTQLMGAGLLLGLVGWLFCAAGSLAAFLLLRTGAPGWSRGTRVDSVLVLTLAGLGAAIAFAPSWDSYTLHTAAGASQTVTAGNAFANPAAVIAGDVVVMVALVAVVAVAALWRPVRYGAALLAGAILPMAAQAISALALLAEGTSPAQFGISPGQAAASGLTINSGLTPAFWIYCAFVAALAVLCARMLRSRSGRPDDTSPGPVTLDATQPPTSAFR